MMNDDIKRAFQVANPFQFKHITHLKSARQFDDVGPCVVMATPSMLQSGVSRELFEAWCGVGGGVCGGRAGAAKGSRLHVAYATVHALFPPPP